ncbi:MAG: class I SAM-dependent methyltransferase [Candidatus Aminicenantales bacterium]
MGKALIRTGYFFQSLALVVMKPRDLVEFTRMTYSTDEDIEGWSDKTLIDSGLNADEEAMWENVRPKEGRVLVLGVGGGREAIALAKRGFQVTGIDFIPGMVDNALANARMRGVKIEGLVQDINALDVPARSFDIVWITSGLYSLVPTRRRRIALLNKISAALRGDGYCICGFFRSGEGRQSTIGAVLKKIVQYLTLGNFDFEKGDFLLSNIEFAHGFSSEEEIRGEFEAAGFATVCLSFSSERARGGAVLKFAKPGSPPQP